MISRIFDAISAGNFSLPYTVHYGGHMIFPSSLALAGHVFLPPHPLLSHFPPYCLRSCYTYRQMRSPFIKFPTMHPVTRAITPVHMTRSPQGQHETVRARSLCNLLLPVFWARSLHLNESSLLREPLHIVVSLVVCYLILKTLESHIAYISNCLIYYILNTKNKKFG